MSIFELDRASGANNTLPLRVRKVGDYNRFFLSGSAGTWGSVRSTIDRTKSAGKWCFGVRYYKYTDTYLEIGLTGNGTLPTDLKASTSSLSPIFYCNTGAIWYNNAQAVAGAGAVTAEDAFFTVLVDMDTRKMWVARDDTVLFGGGDPVAGTTPAYTIPGTHALQPAFSLFSNVTGQALVAANKAHMPFTWEGYTPWADVRADLVFSAANSNLIKNRAGANVTASGVKWSVHHATTGEQLAYGLGATITAGEMTLAFDAPVVNGQNLDVVLHESINTPLANFPQRVYTMQAVVA